MRLADNSTSRWDLWAKGRDCPFDQPRPVSNEYWDLVAPLSISSLYLAKNQTYYGQCLLIFDAWHAIRPEQLPLKEWRTFSDDLFAAQNIISRTVMPDHINLATLGNVIPHLHWHITPRYKSDPRWGAPIWTSNLDDMKDVRLPDEGRLALLNRLKSGFSERSPL